MAWNDLSVRWKNYFIRELHNIADMSMDENTHVGAIIIDTERKVVLSKGYNDLPRGVVFQKNRLSRPDKYHWITHAEQNALYNALHNNSSVSGATLLSTLYCCSTCAGGVIQSGISEVVCPTPDWTYPSLSESFKVTKAMFAESGVNVIFDEELKYDLEKR